MGFNSGFKGLIINFYQCPNVKYHSLKLYYNLYNSHPFQLIISYHPVIWHCHQTANTQFNTGCQRTLAESVT